MGQRPYDRLIVILFATLVFLGCIVSPPSLMDDVDAANAQIARNMLDSGDWVTAHLDGVLFMEKAPLHYWLIAVSTQEYYSMPCYPALALLIGSAMARGGAWVGQAARFISVIATTAEFCPTPHWNGVRRE